MFEKLNYARIMKGEKEIKQQIKPKKKVMKPQKLNYQKV